MILQGVHTAVTATGVHLASTQVRAKFRSTSVPLSASLSFGAGKSPLL